MAGKISLRRFMIESWFQPKSFFCFTQCSTLMKDQVLLWYNELLGQYFVGDEKSCQSTKYSYDAGHITVLYTMERDQLVLCEKIRDRLNEARSMARAC